MTDVCSHQDMWLSLPWLANGRLSGAERLRVEEHVRGCALWKLRCSDGCVMC